MAFLGIYKAVYDYAPQAEGELSITEGDLLYVVDKSSEDDWWKAKKKASADDEDEPIGLIPNNYVEKVRPYSPYSPYTYTTGSRGPRVSQYHLAKPIAGTRYEELSFPEDAQLQVYDTSDPDWILVGYESDFGFAPANYIELGDAAPEQEPVAEAEAESEPESTPLPPSLPTRPPAAAEPDESRSPPLPNRRPSVTYENSPVAPSGPADALAAVMQGRPSTRAATPPPITIPPRSQYLSEESDQEPSPALPVRPQSTRSNDGSLASPPIPQRSATSATRRGYDQDPRAPPSSTRIVPGGFHMYNINEMVSVMGKKKKMPTTLGVNLKTGIILIAPEKAQDGPTQEWTADKMTHYSREGKHVFLELVRPSKSLDFHAGAKDTAEEIVSALGELAGAIRAEGLREVIAAGTGQGGQKRGQILYDFMAQGDDEVTVAAGDEVIVLDDIKSEEWWQVRRLKTGKEGVVPSSYIEITASITSPTTSGTSAGKSLVAQNRLEEERLTREAVKRDQRAAEVGPGMRLPERHSSLSAGDSSNLSGKQRSRRENGGSKSGSSKSKPDQSKVRVWTDRSKSFSVEAQFLGLKDGKINLHKMNGVKIAVPLAKMSSGDIEYVERVTGVSLDEDKPLADVKRAKSTRSGAAREGSRSNAGASVEPGKSDYDWFQFFLSCDVAVGLCERYAQAFAKDSMDESVLPDVDATILRNLGLREGDIIKVTRFLDKKYGRDLKKRNVSFAEDGDGEDGTSGGLFSGPGGTLRNNTRKGRPAPTVQTNDTIDPKAFSQSRDLGRENSASPSPVATRPKAADKGSSGFDDDAWDVKPAKQPESQPKSTPTPEAKPAPPQPQSAPTQAMLDLSLLSSPLEPAKVQSTVTAPAVTRPAPQPQNLPQQAQAQPQPQGATPSFFTGIQATPTGPTTPAQPLNLGLSSRQRPTPPQLTGVQGALMPPPPARPLSAPQSAQPSGFAPPPLPMQPQMTGIAPPGQSLLGLSQQQMQQPYMGGFQPQPTGQGMMQFNPTGGMPQQQQTGFGSQQFMQPQMTGAPQQFSPVQAQPTGFPGRFEPGQQFPQQTGVNTFLPPALEPQRTGIPPMPAQMQPQPTGYGGYGQGFNPGLNNAPSQQPSLAPLQPQQTGPAPPVRFGVANKIAPQATGRRANLAQATPQNPFGF
ncbi:Uu.00g014780.m01.CDS01 [Anthostomella pinea]|uniref:Actin cytoskeleton-regulatory complex protein SLA1 n=1 Tax=Anthostomella pinea TaxID=933095 RepID=A0AAI8VYD7_9PEZI|nr:Uu.00g014780.m01.CDS01 [Anthostomella pinea]